MSGDCGTDLSREERLDRFVTRQRVTLRIGSVGGRIANRRIRELLGPTLHVESLEISISEGWMLSGIINARAVVRGPNVTSSR